MSELKLFVPDENFYQNNVTFTSVALIQELLQSLKGIGLNYFTFDRTYNDGSHIRLTSAGKWIEHYYRKKLYDVAIFERNPSVFSEGFMFWSWLDRAVYKEAALFDIAHGLTITQPHKSYCDFYHFGTSVNNHISEAVLSTQIDTLHRFIAIFHQKSYNLIKKAELNRFILPTKNNLEFSLSDLTATKQILNLNQGNIKRFYLGDEYENSYLTGKEVEVLIHLSKGNRLADIAKILYISEKTVETHIENIKNKLKCRTMFELGLKAVNLGIHRIFPLKT